MKQGDLGADEMDDGRYFPSIRIRNKFDSFYWEIINVYGPV
jgi:hypothetical protein